MKNAFGICNRDKGGFRPTRRGHFDECYCGDQITTFSQRENIGSLAPAFKKILVPISLAGGSADSLALAGRLARQSSAQIVLLHVVELNIAGEERGIHRTRLLSDLRQAAELELTLLAASIGDRVTTEVIVSAGRPAEAIVQTAVRVRADVIVMSIRSHHRWWKWLHRNTAPHVIRQAPCEVILVSADHPERKRISGNVGSPRAGKAFINLINHENYLLDVDILLLAKSTNTPKTLH